MFAGHAAIAVLLGSARPRVRFVPLVVAAYGADVVEIALHGVGASHPQAMFWSHSLALMSAAAAAAAALAQVAWRDRTTSLLVFAAWMSHWLADLLTGSGKPTWEGGPRLGLALYERPAVDFAIEAGLVLLAMVAYRWRRPRRTRRAVLVAAVLVALQLGFNLSDSEGLKGLKGDLLRASGAVGDTARGAG